MAAYENAASMNAAPKGVSPLDNLSAGLRSLGEFTERLERVADALCGPRARPPAGRDSDRAGALQPSGLIEDRAASLHQLNARLASDVDTLERLLPLP